MKIAKVIDDNTVFIDGEYYQKVSTQDLDFCPNCFGEVFEAKQEGFTTRYGCLRCNIWFNKPRKL